MRASQVPHETSLGPDSPYQRIPTYRPSDLPILYSMAQKLIDKGAKRHDGLPATIEGIKAEFERSLKWHMKWIANHQITYDKTVATNQNILGGAAALAGFVVGAKVLGSDSKGGGIARSTLTAMANESSPSAPSAPSPVLPYATTRSAGISTSSSTSYSSSAGGSSTSSSSTGGNRTAAVVDAATTVANAERETREKDEARKAAEVEARKKAGEQAAKDQRTREEARKAAEAEAKKKAEELATARARDKAEKEARERAEKEAQKRAETDYLRSLRAGARARAQTCPDGEGKYYAVAKLPRLPKDVVSCIDVHFRAACPGSANYSTGVGHNFVDGFSCFGSDTVELSPKPQCKVGDVRVEVTDVTPCK